MKDNFYVVERLDTNYTALHIVKAKRSDLAMKMVGGSSAYKLETRKEAEDFRESKIKNDPEFVRGKYIEYIPQKYAID